MNGKLQSAALGQFEGLDPTVADGKPDLLTIGKLQRVTVWISDVAPTANRWRGDLVVELLALVLGFVATHGRH